MTFFYVCRIITTEEATQLLNRRTGFLASTVLFTHAPYKYKTVQSMMGVDLWVNGVNEKIFKILNSVGVSLSLQAARDNVDHIAREYCNGMELWVAAIIKV